MTSFTANFADTAYFEEGFDSFALTSDASNCQTWQVCLQTRMHCPMPKRVTKMLQNAQVDKYAAKRGYFERTFNCYLFAFKKQTKLHISINSRCLCINRAS